MFSFKLCPRGWLITLDDAAWSPEAFRTVWEAALYLEKFRPDVTEKFFTAALGGTSGTTS